MRQRGNLLARNNLQNIRVVGSRPSTMIAVTQITSARLSVSKKFARTVAWTRDLNEMWNLPRRSCQAFYIYLKRMTMLSLSLVEKEEITWDSAFDFPLVTWFVYYHTIRVLIRMDASYQSLISCNDHPCFQMHNLRLDQMWKRWYHLTSHAYHIHSC